MKSYEYAKYLDIFLTSNWNTNLPIMNFKKMGTMRTNQELAFVAIESLIKLSTDYDYNYFKAINTNFTLKIMWFNDQSYLNGTKIRIIGHGSPNELSASGRNPYGVDQTKSINQDQINILLYSILSNNWTRPPANSSNLKTINISACNVGLGNDNVLSRLKHYIGNVLQIHGIRITGSSRSISTLYGKSIYYNERYNVYKMNHNGNYPVDQMRDEEYQNREAYKKLYKISLLT